MNFPRLTADAFDPTVSNIFNNTSTSFPNISIDIDSDNYFVTTDNPPPLQILPAPTTENSNPSPISNPVYESWKKKDLIILIWIKAHLSERVLRHTARTTTSQSTWIAIEKYFQSQTKAKYHHLTNQLRTLQKGSLSMFEYIERKRNIADSLAECGHVVSALDLMQSIINGLDVSYQPFKSAYKLNRILMVLYSKKKLMLLLLMMVYFPPHLHLSILVILIIVLPLPP